MPDDLPGPPGGDRGDHPGARPGPAGGDPGDRPGDRPTEPLGAPPPPTEPLGSPTPPAGQAWAQQPPGPSGSGHGQPGYGPPDGGQPGYGTPGYGTPGYGTPYGGPPGYGYGYPAGPQTDSSATAALVIAIVGFFICPPVGAIVALVMANSAQRRIEASGGRLIGLDQAKAARIIAIIELALTAAVLLIGALAIAASLGPRY